MVKQHQLAPPPGSRKRSKRYGRGDGSGRGSYSGRGTKGQKARSGSKQRAGWEGGQLPLIKRLPTRRGFNNPFRKEYALVTLEQLERHGQVDTEITPAWMAQAGLVRGTGKRVKVLGNGALGKPLRVTAHRFSTSAREKIVASGGTVQELEPPKAGRRSGGGSG